MRDRNKNVLFSQETDISYNRTNPEIIRAGRFNQPKRATFYASIPVDEGEIDTSTAACLEACKALTDKENPFNLLDITIGRWTVVSPFQVLNICFDKDHLKNNASLRLSVEQYLSGMESCLSAESFDFVETVK